MMQSNTYNNSLTADKDSADVSLIVPNYNNGKYLKPFIDSVLESTVLPREMIIVDDGSTDNSKEILQSYRYLPFLKTVYFDKNKGLTAALNAALDSATGSFIMRADPDDLFLPKRIEQQVDFLKSNPDVDIVGTNVIYFSDIDGSVVNTSNFPLTHQEITSRYRNGEHGLQHPTVCARAKVYQSYRYQKIFPAEDYEIFSRMVKDGRTFANLPEPLYMMRVHPGSSTSNIKYADIRQTFYFRDKIFGTSTSEKHIRKYFNYIRYYRKFQLAEHGFRKMGYLIKASYYYPAKLLRRIFR